MFSVSRLGQQQSRRILSILVRKESYNSSSSSSITVPLSFLKYDTSSSSSSKKQNPLIICHGLFGSKQNWKSLGKALSLRCQCPVYTIDARNHGDSPHVQEHTNELIANDVLRFIQDHHLENPILMGHSMGGKVMMNLALRQPKIPSKLVIIDMAPIKLKLSHEFNTHVQAMAEIDSKQLVKQKEADEILQRYEPDLTIRQFLLTNLKKDKRTGIYKFRIPYEILGQNLGHMGDFVPIGNNRDGAAVYERSTLFITGGKSPFRKQFLQYPEEIKQQFPNSHVENIENAGHWVQTEAPEQFLDISSEFINKRI